MKCSNCHFANPDGMRFCVNCGYQLFVVCEQCHAEMAPTYNFCGQCGAPLGNAQAAVPVPAAVTAAPGMAPPPPVRPAQPAPITAAVPEAAAATSETERKQVTVFSCELAPGDDTASSDNLHELLSYFLTLAQEEIERYGGTVNRTTDQGLLALFGAPVAYEDHPRRAIFAARGLRRRLTESRREDVVAASLRIGIDTGPVVVGGAGGMAVGEATQVASALRRAAVGDEVLISESTARLVRGQLALTLLDGTRELEGHGERGLYTVSSTSESVITSPFASKNVTPFVGRQRELLVLEQLGEQASRTEGQVAALTGPAGSGKSRLLHEYFLRTYAETEGTTY
ncbi:MAG: zinc-ribbon domain-containing protein, partial [Acidobacteriota bacterium]